MAANELDCIKWTDRKTGITLFGVVNRVLINSVIVVVNGLDDSTVVSHKRYEIIEEGEIDESATENFRNACRAMGIQKPF